MVFGFIVKPLVAEIKKELTEDYLRNLVIDSLNDEEFQKQIIAFTDDLYERYKAKVFSTIGGMQKGANSSGEDVFPEIIDKKGHIRLSGLLPMLLGGQRGNKPQSALP